MKARGRRRTRAATAVKAGAKISEHTLDNGLRVLVAERHDDPVVAVMTWYKVGARNEREDEAGVSHFLEHMMFKGSARYAKGEVDRVTTQAGGNNNAFTSYDHTAYWFELASDRWEQALDIEVDRMTGLSIDAVEFEAEREVVLEELAMGLDDPWRRLADLVQGAVFARHPYRRPIIGHADALRALTPEGMRDYYRRFYHPGNATLVVCGDVTVADALAAIERRFADLPAGPSYAEADAFRPGLEPPLGEQRVAMTWDDQGRRLIMAWPSGAVGSDDDWALDVISSVLSGGRSARLYRRLVLEQGLATSVSTHNDARIEGGVFWVFAECAQGVEPAALEAAIEAELELLCTHKVPTRELARVRSMLAASDAQDGETVTDLAEDLGEFAVDADWRMSVDGLERLLAVSADDLRNGARRVLALERRVVGWCTPLEPTAARRPARRKRA
ncbi:MAG TPA: pitrilysin family protein [Planctomycetota bacterium]|nr:pitrilysin family protein [Planctomycetota bacterium]